MTTGQGADLIWGAAGGIAAYLGFLAVVLLALALVGMVRR